MACPGLVHLEFVLKGVCCVIMSFFGVIGNSISFFVFSKGRKKNTILILLRALAVADSLYLIGYVATHSWYQFYAYEGNTHYFFLPVQPC